MQLNNAANIGISLELRNTIEMGLDFSNLYDFDSVI